MAEDADTPRRPADGPAPRPARVDPPGITTAEDLGRYLRTLRGPLKQQRVADRSVIGHAALTRQRVSYLENGQLPSAEQLRCYLQGCGIPDRVADLEPVRARLAADTTAGPAPAPAAGPDDGPADPATETPARRRPRRLVAIGIPVAIGTVIGIGATALVLRSLPSPPAGSSPAADAVRAPATTGASCAAGYVCVWSGPNFTGRKLTQPPVRSNTECRVLPFAARSAISGSDQNQWVFPAASCAGRRDNLLVMGAVESSIQIAALTHT